MGETFFKEERNVVTARGTGGGGGARVGRVGEAGHRGIELRISEELVEATGDNGRGGNSGLSPRASAWSSCWSSSSYVEGL